MLKKGSVWVILFILCLFSVKAVDLGSANCSANLTTGSYTLTEDMNCDSGNYALSASDTDQLIELDCNEYHINGSGSVTYGLRTFSSTGDRDNLNITNCEIFGFEQGIISEQGYNCFISNSEIHNNSMGIYISGNSGFIENNAFYNNEEGIRLTGSIEGALNTVRNNILFNNSEAGVMFSGTNTKWNNITNNIFYNNELGIYFNADGDENYIFNNTFFSNNLDIKLRRETFSYPLYNLIYNNYFGGEVLDDANGCLTGWNNTNIGNYWVNYTGSVKNIPGIASYSDNFPVNASLIDDQFLSGIQTNESFDAGTFDFEGYSGDYDSISDVDLVQGSYKIEFDEAISFLHDVQLSERVFMGSGFVSMDMDYINLLPGNDLEKQVTVSIPVSGCSRITMYHSSTHVTSQSEWDENKVECDSGTTPACNLVGCAGNTLIFTVDHLDGAGGEGLPPVPEFSNTTLMLAIMIIISGLIVIRKRLN